jgi:two-component system KDP operon response regulator KdpE
MSLRILIVEDEKEIRKFLRLTLEAADYVVDEAVNARDAQQSILASRPDVVILDLGLPDQDGQDFIKGLREWNEVPVIVLSAREAEAEKVEALENGADDYLTKPFASGELLARIKVAARHAGRVGTEKAYIYDYQGLRADLSSRNVTLNGEEIHLTPIEYKLFATLIRHAGKVLTHTQLLKEVWGLHSAEYNHYLRIHTQHLREKIGDDPMDPRFIITEPGIGYRLRAPL